MATKNIARTVIEGGRASYNKESRYQSNKTHRTHSRNFTNEAKSLIDPDEARVTPKRQKVGKDFDDKLGPMFRWLESQLGRKWDKVYSELVTKFDTRTTAGHHVVFSHLLGSVTLKPTDVIHNFTFSFRRRDYYVDVDGILKRKERTKRESWTRPHMERKIWKWADCKMVMDYGGTSLFWMIPERIEWVRCGLLNPAFSRTFWAGGCSRACEHRIVTEWEKVPSATLLAFQKLAFRQEKVVVDGEEVIFYYKEKKVRQCRQGQGAFKQGARFSAEDLAMWNTLSTSVKNMLLWTTPVSKQR